MKRSNNFHRLLCVTCAGILIAGLDLWQAVRAVSAHISSGFVPLPHTDRPFSGDEFLQVIAVGSVATEFVLVE
jgi:hypothetical protein